MCSTHRLVFLFCSGLRFPTKSQGGESCWWCLFEVLQLRLNSLPKSAALGAISFFSTDSIHYLLWSALARYEASRFHLQRSSAPADRDSRGLVVMWNLLPGIFLFSQFLPCHFLNCPFDLNLVLFSRNFFFLYFGCDDQSSCDRSWQNLSSFCFPKL